MKRLILFLFLTSLLIKGKAQLSIYPNPFSATATITYTLANTDTITLEVVNILGQIEKKLINDSVVNTGTYTISYFPTNLSAGMYLITLITKHGTSNMRFIYQGSASTIQNVNNKISTSFIYPNPASKSININYEGLKKVGIVDLNGRLIKTISTSDKTISIDDIKTGEYFINIYVEKKLIITEKLLKLD